MHPQILMIGTDPHSKGGISAVINLYTEGGLLDRVAYLASYRDGKTVNKIGHYVRFLGEYSWTLLTRHSIRLVHVHTASYGSFTRKSLVIALAKLFGKKVIVHVHGAEFHLFYEKVPGPVKRIIRSLLRSCDAIIALSSQWKDNLYRISGNPNIRVIYNPTVLRTPLANSPDGNGKPVRFLFMGRLGKRKGVYDIIESAKRLQANNVEISLYGDGELDRVSDALNGNAVSEKIKVRGWIDGSRKEETFRAADVLLLPSYNEGLPISVLEAMAFSLPVVATDVGGISEAVKDGVNGYLMQPGDCDRLTECIEKLATSPELRAQMGQAGYGLAMRKFALPVIIEQLESLYDDLINSGRK